MSWLMPGEKGPAPSFGLFTLLDKNAGKCYIIVVIQAVVKARILTLNS